MELEEIQLGDVFEATVTNVGQFGVFVDVGAVKDARLNVPRAVGRTFKRGDVIAECIIDKVDTEMQRMSAALPEDVPRPRAVAKTSAKAKPQAASAQVKAKAKAKAGSSGFFRTHLDTSYIYFIELQVTYSSGCDLLLSAYVVCSFFCGRQAAVVQARPSGSALCSYTSPNSGPEAARASPASAAEMNLFLSKKKVY